jgi:hypothetical protein
MATLLSLPNELVVAIFRWGFEEHWPTIDTIRANFGDFRWNKRLRQLGIQAAAEEASIEIDGDGVLQSNWVRWLGNNRAWPYVRRLSVDLFLDERRPLPVICASTLPVTPSTVLLSVCIKGEPNAIAWTTVFPFPNSLVSELYLCGRNAHEGPRIDGSVLFGAFPSLKGVTVHDIDLRDCAAEGASFPALLDFSDHRPYHHLPNLLRRSPNLRTADLAISVEALPTSSHHVRQFEQLGHFRCLTAIAFSHLDFQEEQCQHALSCIPITVQHLAFHHTAAVNFLSILRSFLGDRQWLPRLQSIYVSVGPQYVAPEEGTAVGQACTRHQVSRCFTTTSSPRFKDEPKWPESPWL